MFDDYRPRSFGEQLLGYLLVFGSLAIAMLVLAGVVSLID